MVHQVHRHLARDEDLEILAIAELDRDDELDIIRTTNIGRQVPTDLDQLVILHVDNYVHVPRRRADVANELVVLSQKALKPIELRPEFAFMGGKAFLKLLFRHEMMEPLEDVNVRVVAPQGMIGNGFALHLGRLEPRRWAGKVIPIMFLWNEINSREVTVEVVGRLGDQFLGEKMTLTIPEPPRLTPSHTDLSPNARAEWSEILQIAPGRVDKQLSDALPALGWYRMGASTDRANGNRTIEFMAQDAERGRHYLLRCRFSTSSRSTHLTLVVFGPDQQGAALLLSQAQDVLRSHLMN